MNTKLAVLQFPFILWCSTPSQPRRIIWCAQHMTEVTAQAPRLTQSEYTEPTSYSPKPIMPDTRVGIHQIAKFKDIRTTRMGNEPRPPAHEVRQYFHNWNLVLTCNKWIEDNGTGITGRVRIWNIIISTAQEILWLFAGSGTGHSFWKQFQETNLHWQTNYSNESFVRYTKFLWKTAHCKEYLIFYPNTPKCFII